MTWKDILKNSDPIVILETDATDQYKKIPKGNSYRWESSPNFHSERDRAVKMAQEKVNELGKKHYFYFKRLGGEIRAGYTAKSKFEILESNPRNANILRGSPNNNLVSQQLLEPQK